MIYFIFPPSIIYSFNSRGWGSQGVFPNPRHVYLDMSAFRESSLTPRHTLTMLHSKSLVFSHRLEYKPINDKLCLSAPQFLLHGGSGHLRCFNVGFLIHTYTHVREYFRTGICSPNNYGYHLSIMYAGNRINRFNTLTYIFYMLYVSLIG